MNESQNWHDNEIAEYWHEAATFRGRMRIRVRLWMKRRLWAAVVGSSLALKRLLDITVAAMALLALSPVFALTAFLIKLEDRGPLFFQQKRVGLRGRLFGMWKFRSMVVNADALKDKLVGQNEMKGGVTFKMKN